MPLLLSDEYKHFKYKWNTVTTIQVLPIITTEIEESGYMTWR